MGNILLGNYPYDKNGTKKPLEWKAIKETDKGTILITKDVIDHLSINNQDGEWAWETCSLKTWLHETFFTQAFSEEEKLKIKEIFILDNQQIYEYLPTMEDRLAEPTEYAVKRGVMRYDGNRKAMWWVRSYGIGNLKTHATFVSYDGFFFNVGRRANAKKYGVRVAILLEK